MFNIDEFITKGENQKVEFKKSDILRNNVELAKQMTAFANTNGGTILIGVCDDGTIEGMRAKKEHENHIMNIARDLCDPPLAPQFFIIPRPEGDIYRIEIPRYQKFPHSAKTRDGRVYFIRVGSTVRETTPHELAILFESAKEEIINRKPKLELLLIDPEGNATTEINAQPTSIKIKKIKSEYPIVQYYHKNIELFNKFIKNITPPITPPSLFLEKELAKDLIPIGIELRNDGEAPARGIRVFLEFPRECELVEENEAIERFQFVQKSNIKPSSGGLFVDSKNRNEARAWVEILGNDLTIGNFKKMYARFPEKEQEYKIKARVTQYNFPPEDFEFKICVKPRIEEKIEYIYDEQKNEV